MNREAKSAHSRPVAHRDLFQEKKMCIVVIGETKINVGPVLNCAMNNKYDVCQFEC